MATQHERVLITGGAGFTGAPLALALRRDGHEVITVGRPGSACDHAADLTESAPIAAVVERVQPTAIIHLAGIAFSVDDNLHRLYTTNVSGAASLLKGAVKCRGALKSVILASTGKVYAPPQSDAPITEDAALSPIDHYGVSKMAMEHVGRLFADQLPITVLRPFNYTGPGQEPRYFVPKLVQAYVQNTNISVGNLNLARDFSDRDTIVEVYRRLIAAPPSPGQTFNVCSGIATPLTEIADILAELTGNAIELKTDPAFVRPEPPVIRGSSARLEQAIGAIARPSLRDTLARMVRAAA